MARMRLDKLLAHDGWGTRKEVKELLAEGVVEVNGEIIKKPGYQVDPDVDEIIIDGYPSMYQKYYYFLLNKPQGIVSARTDSVHETVVEWLGPEYQHIPLDPVGRLDIDTTGLLLITNNGQLSHRLRSPRSNVSKVYQALVDGLVDDSDIETFEKGIDLGDFTTKPARLEVLYKDEEKGQSFVEVEIKEGKFHQVKRMFESVGKTVLTLHRTQMGPLKLDDELSVGEWRHLTEEEQDALKSYGYE